MQNRPNRVISTINLPAEWLPEAAARGVTLHCHPFIEVNAVAGVAQIVQPLADQPIVALFTSGRALDAVLPVLPQPLPWKIACVGAETTAKATAFFGAEALVATADYGHELAKKLVALAPAGPLHFFCGNKRLNDIPDYLQAHNMGLTEHVVYHTVETPVRLTTPYQGVLFFSPTTAHSFFSCNDPEPQVEYFAIGHTTARTVQTYINKPCRLAAEPTRRALVNAALDHFSRLTA